MVQACKHFSDNEPDVDDMYPCINSTKTMYLQGPATYSTILSMYRHILATNGVQATVVA